MKKIILSVAVATMALSTAAAALEDIKVSGQAKLWYETNNGDIGGSNAPRTAGQSGSMFNKSNSTGEVVFKLAITGKQGNVGFGTTIYQSSTMGLEGNLVSSTRTNNTNMGNGTAAGGGGNGNGVNGDMYVGEAYITAPVTGKTLLKFGKQELDTPLAFTERWNAAPNTFDAAVLINNSFDNLTLIAAYVGSDSNTNYASNGLQNPVPYAYGKGTYAAAALYKNDALAVNVWGYELSTAAKAVWVDAAMKAGPIAVKAYAVQMMPSVGDDTTALALSAGMKAGSVKLFAAASTVSEDTLGVANTATGKKTKLPTMGVYTDGVYVAAPGSTAFKLKASTKLAGTGLALQYVNNSNDINAARDGMSEIDLIASKKIGDFNLKGILMHRDGDHGAPAMAKGTDDAQQHVRIIASVNF